MTRIERDSLGERMIPDEGYYGIQTVRAVENFPVSGITIHPDLVRAYAQVKKAAATANYELGSLDSERMSAIVQAAEEIIAGSLGDQFPVDIYQAGAGTSTNMNVNEVIANRALEILGKSRGDYDFLSPNDHVNLAQSTNDTYPTASHIAIINGSDALDDALKTLIHTFQVKGVEFADMPKTGRTHLMDAIPVRLGDEFLAYAASIQRSRERIRQRRDDLLEVAIGGTATGTGTNAHPSYRSTVIPILREITGLPLVPASDSMEALQSRSQMAAFSGSLKELALELIRIANDLRLMNSGPTAGLNELTLPAVQPGSSIMPGKVNPVMAECLNMISFRVIGNDTTVCLAAQAGQLELNVMTPVMTSVILESLTLLTRFLPVFTSHCLSGIIAHTDQLSSLLRLNPILATVIAPRIGYLQAARLVKESQEQNRPIPDIAVEKGILSREEADSIFNLEQMSANHYRHDEV